MLNKGYTINKTQSLSLRGLLSTAKTGTEANIYNKNAISFN